MDRTDRTSCCHQRSACAAGLQPQRQQPVERVAPSVDTTATRYAIYYAPPPASAWWTFGSAWLGRDAVTGASMVRPALPAWTSAKLSRITAEPRRYGFHATLRKV